MARRVATVAALAWGGMAFAQTPAFVPNNAPPAEGTPGSVVTLKTAGQPDRKLQVLKAERLPDGKILTEVKDLASGQVFTIADTKMLGTGEAKAALPIASPAIPQAAAKPQAPPAMPPQTLPGTTVPASYLPQAKPRQSDPLMGGAPSEPTTTAQPKSPGQAEFPTLVGRLREKRETASNTPATPQQQTQQSGISRALFGNYNDAPQSPTPLVGRITEPTPPKPLTAPATAQNSGGLKAAVFGNPNQPPAETPTLMGKLFGDKPATPVQAPPTQVVKQPGHVIRPNAVGTTTTSARVGATPAFDAPVMAAAPVAAPVTPPAPKMEVLTPVSMDVREPNFQVVPIKPMTMKQIEDMVKDLRMHHKPSLRLEAANSLAASPMAGMVEVRQIIAEASYRDPMPVVRAHCIDLLTKMHYDEPNYRKYVESLVNDEEPAVQRAARNAVK